MKKTVGAILALFLCLSLSPAARAAENAPFQNAGELYQSWHDNAPGAAFPYPEYVNGVWSADGGGENLCFSLTAGAPESVKEEILSQIVDKNSVTFVEGGSYTIRELYAIQEELTGRMGEDTGIYMMGISQREGVLVIGIDTENPNAEAVMEEYTGRYGALIRFEDNGGARPQFTTSASHGMVQVSPASGPWLLAQDNHGVPLCLLLAGALFMAALLFLWLSRRGVTRTAHGDTVSVAGTLTARQVETAIRGACRTPDDRLHEAILERLAKIS